MAIEMIEKTVMPEEHGLRLDKYLRLAMPHLQQSLIEKSARKGLLKVNSKKSLTSYRVEAGQKITFPKQFLALETDLPTHKEKDLSHAERKWLKSLILFEDDDIIVINKPAGTPVQKGTKQHKAIDSMMNAYYEDLKARLVHRLDKDTSGILLMAKSMPAARFLTHAFKERDIHKVYWAVVCGVPPKKEGLISLPLSKKADSTFEKVHVDYDTGLHATTYYRVIESLGNKLSWLELSPKTGRTHQLRVHCSEGLKTPILGDGKYGGKEAFPTGRKPLHLHARSLTFPHPKGNSMTFEAPLPKELQESFIELGFELV